MRRIPLAFLVCAVAAFGQRAPLQNLPPLGGPAGGFSPLSISGCIVWLKADSLSLNDGDAVPVWSDSATGVAWTAITANTPSFKTGIINGNPVLRFDGVNDRLTQTGVSIPSTRTIIGVFTDNGSDNYASIFTAGTSDGWYFRGALHNLSEFFGGSDHLTTTTITAGTPVIITEIYTVPNLFFWKNGAAAGTSNPGGNPPVRNFDTIGDDAGTETFKGDLAELIVYNSALSTADRQSVERYLGTKYGISVP